MKNHSLRLEGRLMPHTPQSRKAAARKAAHTLKWRRAAGRALVSARNAKTFTLHKLSMKGYHCISLDAPSGYEGTGIVDLVAVRRGKDRDQLEILLIQAKGGSAKIDAQQVDRLEEACRKARIRWVVAEKPGKSVKLLDRLSWREVPEFPPLGHGVVFRHQDLPEPSVIAFIDGFSWRDDPNISLEACILATRPETVHPDEWERIVKEAKESLLVFARRRQLRKLPDPDGPMVGGIRTHYNA